MSGLCHAYEGAQEGTPYKSVSCHLALFLPIVPCPLKVHHVLIYGVIVGQWALIGQLHISRCIDQPIISKALSAGEVRRGRSPLCDE